MRFALITNYIMKKTVLLLLFSISIGSVMKAQLNVPEAVAWIDFSTETQHKTTLATGNPDNEHFTESVVFDGVKCRKIPKGKFMYLTFGRDVIPTSGKDLIISVTYFDNNSNDLWFNYNAPDNNYKGADFKKGDSQGWVTTIVMISDAQFAGKMGGNDIRLGHNGGDNYIKEIRVSRGSFDPDKEAVPPKQNLTGNQFKGKSFAGYQIWHEAGPNDADWIHWTYGHVPGPGFHMPNGVDVSSYPDVSEYEDELLYDTKLGDLGNGRSAGLYN